jgi:hypothetical protein
MLKKGGTAVYGIYGEETDYKSGKVFTQIIERRKIKAMDFSGKFYRFITPD